MFISPALIQDDNHYVKIEISIFDYFSFIFSQIELKFKLQLPDNE